MDPNTVLQARSLTPVSTIVGTVVNGQTVNLIIYKSLAYKGHSTTMRLDEFLSEFPSSVLASESAAATSHSGQTERLVDVLSGLESQSSVLASSARSAEIAASVSAALSTESHQITTVTAFQRATPIPSLTTATRSVGRVGPELVPITPIITPTLTTTTTTSLSSITEKPSPTTGPISIDVSNNLNPGAFMNPTATIGIVFGVVMGLIVAAALTMFLLRRRRPRSRSRSRHHRPTSPTPMLVIPRPVEPPSELPWPTSLPDPDYFAPKKIDDEVAHELPKRPRLSGETFTEEDRVGHATWARGV